MLVVMATLDGRTTVESFLSVIHLERYLDTFHQAGLLLAEDFTHLDHDSLVSLGVIATGHRKRILRLVAYIQSQIHKRSASGGQGANLSSAGARDVPSLDRCQSESDIHSPEAGPTRSRSSNQELASANVEISRNSSSPNLVTTATMTSTTFTTTSDPATSTDASNGALPGGSASSSSEAVGQRSQFKPVPKPRTVFNRRRTAPVTFTCPQGEPEAPSQWCAPRRLSQESICFTALETLTSPDDAPPLLAPPPTAAADNNNNNSAPRRRPPRNHNNNNRGRSSPPPPSSSLDPSPPEGPSPPVPPRLTRPPPPHPPHPSSSSLSPSSSSSCGGGGGGSRPLSSSPSSSSPSLSSPPRRRDDGDGRMEMVSNEIYCGSAPLAATPLPPPRLTLNRTPERNSCSTLSNNSSGSTRASTDDPEEEISPYCETVYRHTPPCEDDGNKMEGRETMEDKPAEDHGSVSSQRRWWSRRLSQALHSGAGGDGGGGGGGGEEEELTISPYASYTVSSERPAPLLCGWLDKLSPQGNYVFQKRYVKFDGKNLMYFGSEKDVYPKGVIPLAAIQMARPAKDNKFEIVTTHRIFVFRTDNEAVRQHWVVTLQERVRDQLVFGRPRFGPGPHCQRHGALELKGTKNKVYTAINTEHIWLYKTEQCFRTGIGITLIEARGSTIRDGKHRSFDLITPYKTFSFTAESEREKRDWMEALQESIAETLSDYEVAEKIWSNLSNRMCADCRAINPDWASINLCVVICKNCAGQHRGLGTMISKVQSLKLDTSVWSNEIVQLFITVGNDRANDFWASRLPACEELDCNATPDQRREFIHLKYREGRYRQPHPGFNTQEELLKVLCMAVTEQTLLRTVTQIFCEAERLSASNGCVNIHTHTNTVDSSVYDEIMQPVIHSGFLYKSTSMHKGTLSRKTRDDFKKFWCTVDHSVLLYESEHSAEPSLSISTRDILCVGVSRPDNTNHNNGFIDRFRYTFELFLSSEKLYQFGLETAEALHSWTNAIGKAATPLSCHCLLTREFERVGTLRYRAMLDPQRWRHAHFVLQKSNLFVCPTNDGAAEDIINLNRLQELSITSESDGQEKKDTLVLVEKGRTLHLQGAGRGDFSLWSGDIHRAAGGKGNSLREQQLSRNGIPIIVDSCIAFITQYGLTHEGIYRKNGATSRIKLLMDEFRKDARNVKLRIGDNFLEDVTDVLKRFFREIDDPIFMMDLHPLWCEAAKFSQRRQRLDRYKDIIRSLPRVHRTTLSALISHLYRVQRCADLNQMCTKNLSLLFAPSLFQTDGKGEHEVKIVEDLIDNYLVVFDVDEEHQTQMELEVSLITTWKDTQLSQAGDLIIEVYLEMKIPDCCITLKVSPTMSAEELTNQVLYLRNVPAGDKDMWMTFETVEDGQLERPLHPKEKVLEQALQWCKMADPSSAYLVVKKVPKGECTHLLTAYRSEVMKVGLLRCREEPPKLLQGNRFQDRTFQIRNQKLVLLKDKKSIKPEKEWPLKTMKVYIGIRRKLKAPTRWGFTVMMDKHQLFLCCHTEADLWDWITSFLRAQNDQAPPPPVLRRHSSSDISKQRFGTMPLVPVRGDRSNATMLSANQTLRKLHARRTLSMFFPMKAHQDSFEERSNPPDVCVAPPPADPVVTSDPADLGEPLYEEVGDFGLQVLHSLHPEEVGDFGLQVLQSLQTSFLSSQNEETQEVHEEDEGTPGDPRDPPALRKSLSLDRSSEPAPARPARRALRAGSLSLEPLVCPLVGAGAPPGGSSSPVPGGSSSPDAEPASSPPPHPHLSGPGEAPSSSGPQFPPSPSRWQQQEQQELLLQELSSVFTKKTQETQELSSVFTKKTQETQELSSVFTKKTQEEDERHYDV